MKHPGTLPWRLGNFPCNEGGGWLTGRRPRHENGKIQILQRERSKAFGVSENMGRDTSSTVAMIGNKKGKHNDIMSVSFVFRVVLAGYLSKLIRPIVIFHCFNWLRILSNDERGSFYYLSASTHQDLLQFHRRHQNLSRLDTLKQLSRFF